MKKEELKNSSPVGGVTVTKMPAIQTLVKDTIKEVKVESKLSEPTKIVSPTPAVAKDISKLVEAPKDV